MNFYEENSLVAWLLGYIWGYSGSSHRDILGLIKALKVKYYSRHRSNFFQFIPTPLIIEIDLNNARNKALRSAYKDFSQELSAVLYEVDPIGAAAGGGAPIDEYSHEAAILAAALCNVRSRDEIAECLNKLFGICSESFIDKVDKPLQKFRAHPAHQ